MSVYKLIPSHYVRLQQPARPEALPPPCSAEQFENLTLLLRTSNAKLAGLAATVRDLREQLHNRDATIAELRARLQARTGCSVSSNVEVTSGARTHQPEDVVVDVTSDMQVRLRVELVDQGAYRPPLVKVASTVVTRRPATSPAAPTATSASTKTATPTAIPSEEKQQAAPGPMRSASHGGAKTMASPLYASLMWRTRQRAKELGYRFVWSRYGKILVKKDVQSPPMYILEETDLRKMG